MSGDEGQLLPNCGACPGGLSGSPSLSMMNAKPWMLASADATPSTASIVGQEVERDLVALVADEPAGHLEGGLLADDRVDALVGVGEEVVEALLDRVGEHEGAGHERDAGDDGDRGEEDPDLVAEDVLEGDLEHGGPDQSPKRFSRSSTASAVGDCISSTMRPSARKSTRSA